MLMTIKQRGEIKETLNELVKKEEKNKTRANCGKDKNNEIWKQRNRKCKKIESYAFVKVDNFYT